MPSEPTMPPKQCSNDPPERTGQAIGMFLEYLVIAEDEWETADQICRALNRDCRSVEEISGLRKAMSDPTETNH